MIQDFDIVVVGGGAGGGTLAADCARRGRRVLLIERGSPASSANCKDERATLIDKVPYDDRAIDISGQPRRLYMGGILGGGTSLYGAALLRPAPADFEPGRYYARRLPYCLWSWPIQYEDLEPFYSEAEDLYEVHSSPQDAFDPIAPPRHSADRPALPLAPINEHLIASSRSTGLRPFRLPLAIRTRTCLRCDRCAGFVCPNGSRRSAAQLVAETQGAGWPLTVMTQVEAERFELGRDGAAGLWVRHRETGASSLLRATRYVLAAGAIGSPALLLRSGCESEQLGRNYMMHYSPVAVGWFARPTDADRTFVKQVGFADYYFGSRKVPEKLGLIQSLPAPGEAMLAKNGLRWLPTALRERVRRYMLPLVGIVEDLPNPRNRVTLTQDGIRLEHAYNDYDRQRGEELSRRMKSILRGAGAIAAMSGMLPSQEHVAHQCGTLRFGNDRREAVTDRNCRLFGTTNLFVADGSVLPTSLGVGPSLTIIANALRVARIVASEV